MTNLLALLRLLPDAVVQGQADTMILHTTADSRHVVAGSLFVAIRGTSFDGHSTIKDAIEKGAVCVVVDMDYDRTTIPPSITVVAVPDTRLAYARIVHFIRNQPSDGLRIYGVTGTNGKTTCATILEQLFRTSGRTTGFIGTTGIRYDGTIQDFGYTTPHVDVLCDIFVAMRKHRVDTVCMEVSSHALDQYRTYGIRFSAALFTNLTHDHLDYHGTMEAYAATKKRLFDGLEQDAAAIVWGDDPYAALMVKDCKARRIVRVGTNDDNDVIVEDVSVGAHGTTFTLVLPPRHRTDVPHDLVITTQLIGRFNVANAALCAVTAIQEGMPPAKVAECMARIKGPAGRMERYPLASGAVAVVDYAHTPDALEQALTVLQELVPSGSKLYTVFGCGGDRDATKRPVMGRIATEHADHAWITNDNPRSENPGRIAEGILSGIADKTLATVELDRRLAITQALDRAKPGDIVLIAGKGHETYQVIGTDRIHFSDVGEVAHWNAAHR